MPALLSLVWNINTQVMIIWLLYPSTITDHSKWRPDARSRNLIETLTSLIPTCNTQFHDKQKYCHLFCSPLVTDTIGHSLSEHVAWLAGQQQTLQPCTSDGVYRLWSLYGNLKNRLKVYPISVSLKVNYWLIPRFCYHCPMSADSAYRAINNADFTSWCFHQLCFFYFLLLLIDVKWKLCNYSLITHKIKTVLLSSSSKQPHAVCYYTK